MFRSLVNMAIDHGTVSSCTIFLGLTLNTIQMLILTAQGFTLHSDFYGTCPCIF